MKYIGEIIRLSNCGNETEVEIGNVERKWSPRTGIFRQDIRVRIPFAFSIHYPLGRKVEIEVKPK